MTEIVEYSLVVMASTLFIAGSVATFSSFSAFESDLQLRATFAAVSALAERAAMNGSSGAILTLPSSTVTCVDGSLSVSIGASTLGQSIPATCNFGVRVEGGSHLLRFSEQGSRLSLTVT